MSFIFAVVLSSLKQFSNLNYYACKIEQVHYFVTKHMSQVVE